MDDVTLIIAVYAVVAMVLVGAFCAGGTFLHYFALGIDILGSLLTVHLWGVTLSTWAGIEKDNKRAARWLYDALNYLQPMHCEQARVADTKRLLESLNYVQNTRSAA